MRRVRPTPRKSHAKKRGNSAGGKWERRKKKKAPGVEKYRTGKGPEPLPRVEKKKTGIKGKENIPALEGKAR